MATKLKSLLRGLRLPLLLNAALFAGGLFIVYLVGLDWLAAALFLLLAIYLYSHPKGNLATTSIIGIAAVVINLALMSYVTSPLAALSLAAMGGVLWCLIIGIKNVEFLERREWHLFATDTVIYGVLVLFFLANQTVFSVINILALAGFAYLVHRELLKDYFAESVKKPDLALASGILSLIAVKIAWVASLLPLGFISDVNAVMITLLCAQNLIIRKLENRLTARFTLLQISFFGLAMLLIAGTTSWSL